MNVSARRCVVFVVFLVLSDTEPHAQPIDEPRPISKSYGFFVFVAPSSGVSKDSIAYTLPYHCHVVKDLHHEVFRQEGVNADAVLDDTGLGVSIRKELTEASMGGKYFGRLFDPGLKQMRQCMFSSPWILLPEAQLAIGPLVIQSSANTASATLTAGHRLRMMLPLDAATFFRNSPLGTRVEVTLEQLALRTQQAIEGSASSIKELSLYTGVVYQDQALDNRLSRTFNFLIQALPVERELDDFGKQILARLNSEPKYIELTTAFLVRFPDSSDQMGRSFVLFPGLAAGVFISPGQSQTPRQSIWIASADHSSKVRLSEGVLSTLQTQRDCTLIGVPNKSVIIDENKGVYFRRSDDTPVTAVQAKPRIGKAVCRVVTDTNDGTSVLVTDSIGIEEYRKQSAMTGSSSSRKCVWDDSCRVWFSVGSSCEVRAICADPDFPARLRVLGDVCTSSGNADRWICNANTVNECKSIVNSARWNVLLEIGNGRFLPLCQAQ